MRGLILLAVAAEGAWLTPAEVTRIASDMNAAITCISARRESAWLMRLSTTLFADGQLPRPHLHLLAGSETLDQTLVAALPTPPGLRTSPAVHKTKDFFGGSRNGSVVAATASAATPRPDGARVALDSPGPARLDPIGVGAVAPPPLRADGAALVGPRS